MPSEPAPFPVLGGLAQGILADAQVPVDRGCLLYFYMVHHLVQDTQEAAPRWAAFSPVTSLGPPGRQVGYVVSVHIHTLILLLHLAEEEHSRHPTAEIPLILGHCSRVTCQNNNC